jgi:hypothetical protein
MTMNRYYLTLNASSAPDALGILTQLGAGYSVAALRSHGAGYIATVSTDADFDEVATLLGDDLTGVELVEVT